MKRFNMTDDQLASMEEHMADLMQQAQESGAMMPMMDGDMQNPDDTGDDFVPGGSPVFPFGFGGTPKAEEKGEKSKKQRGRGQRKYLDTYCENLTQKAKDGSWMPSLAVTVRYTARCRFCAAARKTTPAGGLDFRKQALDALFKLAAELGACHKGRQVQQVDLFIL